MTKTMHIYTRLIGFNRYMVECESFKCDLNRTTGMGFNRYMVECECNRNG